MRDARVFHATGLASRFLPSASATMPTALAGVTGPKNARPIAVFASSCYTFSIPMRALHSVDVSALAAHIAPENTVAQAFPAIPRLLGLRHGIAAFFGKVLQLLFSTIGCDHCPRLLSLQSVFQELFLQNGVYEFACKVHRKTVDTCCARVPAMGWTGDQIKLVVSPHSSHVPMMQARVCP